MKLIGINYLTIKGNRKEKPQGKIDIKQDVDIKNIEEETLAGIDKEGLRISFDFTLTYGSDFANITIKGFVLIIPTPEEKKELVKEWKEKKVPVKFRVPIFNFIMNKCSLKAVNLQDDLAIPSHLPIPRITEKK